MSKVCTDYDLMVYGAYAAAAMTNTVYNDTFHTYDSSSDQSSLDYSYVSQDSSQGSCSTCDEHQYYTVTARRSSALYHQHLQRRTMLTMEKQMYHYTSQSQSIYDSEPDSREHRTSSVASANTSSGFSSSFNSSASMHEQVQMVSPCSNSSQEVQYNPYSSMDRNPVHLYPTALGPCPSCVGRESSPVRGTVRDRHLNSYHKKPALSQSLANITTLQTTNRMKSGHSDTDCSSVASDFVYEKTTTCCPGFGLKKGKSMTSKALNKKFKKFNRQITQADKSASDPSLKTLAVL